MVDDEQDVNTTLKKVLEGKGYDIHAFINPIDALKDFRKDLYNLIILDIIMPQMNGYEFYNEIQKIDVKVKVCFLTVGEMNYDKNLKIFSKNIFLRKPIENEVLLKTIKNILES